MVARLLTAMDGLQALNLLQAMSAGAAAVAGQRPAQPQPQPAQQQGAPPAEFVPQWGKYDTRIELKRANSKQNILSIPQVLSVVN